MCHGQIIDHAIRKSRKWRRCFECSREIVPGERYEHQVGTMDGEFHVWDGCPQCATKNDVLWREYGDDMCYVSVSEAWRDLILTQGPRAVREMYSKAKALLFKPVPEESK